MKLCNVLAFFFKHATIQNQIKILQIPIGLQNVKLSILAGQVQNPSGSTDLLTGGPGSLPHHETFGRATLFIRGSSTAPWRTHVGHLSLVLHDVGQLMERSTTVRSTRTRALPPAPTPYAAPPTPDHQHRRVCRATHVFFLQVEKVVDGFVHQLRTARHCHKVGIRSSALGEPKIDLERGGGQSRSVGGGQSKSSGGCLIRPSCVWTGIKCLLSPNLEVVHDLADALAAGSNDAGVDLAVQGDVLRDHLLQLIDDSLDGVSCRYGFVLVSCDGDLILWDRQQQHRHWNLTRRGRIWLPLLLTPVLQCNHHYLVLIILIWELNVHVMLGANVGDDGALAANDFGVILWVHSDGQLVTPQSLEGTTLWHIHI